MTQVPPYAYLPRAGTGVLLKLAPLNLFGFPWVSGQRALVGQEIDQKQESITNGLLPKGNIAKIAKRQGKIRRGWGGCNKLVPNCFPFRQSIPIVSISFQGCSFAVFVTRLKNMAHATELWGLLTLGNVLLSVLFLLLLHYLVEFYQFRGMPPGPRLYSIPFFGNFLSFDDGAGKSLRESTQRWEWDSRFVYLSWRSYSFNKFWGVVFWVSN